MMRRLTVRALIIVAILNAAFATALFQAPGSADPWGPRPPLLHLSTTEAFFLDTETSTGNFIEADVPIPFGCVFWANATTGPNVFKITGSNHIFRGCLHSNHDLELGGSTHVFHRTLRHVQNFKTNDNGHILHNGTVQVPAEPYPITFKVADYAPGTPKAEAATSDGNYTSSTASITIDNTNVRGGLWYVNGAVTYKPNNFTGRLTIVATGGITVASTGDDIRAYTDGLFLLSHKTGPNAVKLGPSDGRIVGAVYDIHGEVAVSGNGVNFDGQVIGQRITISGQSCTFTVNTPLSVAST